ncbi:tRNA (adenosine(37)-N6)-threonylcarbamoyltransferase complex transferase subunit TsaD [Edaphocola flava]|jgi:N6-L-threonylcarbamoyladenine synthase|uniref:tRNA (adenosine(37)-N6)-threonylcarbamoyltransferase complex transferase subunit TsaD n=1 Tax=Edaphocola flava TaxID=2499629 RepID=UPI00100AAE85|nr:tRNA (adenosine(37)-N6)-threonylcarbamoyltransferase complex transferase subunit TsaD [Edaphocola flava]
MEVPQHQIILAIESSCDETAASVIKDGQVLSNIIATQKVHEQYGGVVPEIASRTHLQHIVPVVDQALKTAGISKDALQAIAFTQAPGLLGSLLVGSSFAKGMAQALNIPLIGVHHMQAHVLAHFIEDPKPAFPFLCLTVSGGHTQIVLCHSPLDMEILGETIDDAAGEAFDKIAKMLELPYPGGPLIDRYAQQGNPQAYPFPIPSLEGLNYSFSGIKTAVLYFLQKQKAIDPDFVQKNMADICASVQYTIVTALLKKFEKAAKQYKVRHIGVAGGVSANSGLRTALTELGKKLRIEVYLPKFEYCTDNAAMIAITAHYKMQRKEFTDLLAVPTARAAWK